jgi:hypothetical protein
VIERKAVKKPLNKNILLLLESDNEETNPDDSIDFDVKAFEKIEDLYLGMHAWELLLRVVSKNYREFVSKRGNEVTLLRVEFIDRVGWTIEGCFFGEQAEKHNSAIEKGKVYRISRATLE